MNKLKMSETDKAIISQCGKNARERYEASGTSLKKIVVKWLMDNNYDVENLKNSLILLKTEGKEILCVISTCTEDRNNKNYTVGIESADNYSKENGNNNSWVVLFAMISGEDVTGLRVMDQEKVRAIAKEYTRSSGLGSYFACNFNDVQKYSIEFGDWVNKI